ncbi:lymphoid enhancer-binding factor 1-like [Brachionichthys hirsutus]|uniref:lymphoid enhancer-binding factor 1-like n=1 Tax=Brachionichthys hirsutus TaxID=412623 RepID=UPI003604BF1C
MPAAEQCYRPAAPPQNLWGQCPLQGMPAAEQCYRPAAPPQNLWGQCPLQGMPAAEQCYPPAAPPQTKRPAPKTSKRKLDDGRPYVKKPPNAFMLFLREQRPFVDPSIRRLGSGAVNTALGRQWKSLSPEEQKRYYAQADREKLLHQQQHPEWTGKNNYGKKMKRERQGVQEPQSLSRLN